jgi:hypothetical protein
MVNFFTQVKWPFIKYPLGDIFPSPFDPTVKMCENSSLQKEEYLKGQETAHGAMFNRPGVIIYIRQICRGIGEGISGRPGTES